MVREGQSEGMTFLGRHLSTIPKATEETSFVILGAIGLSHCLNDAIQSVIPAIYPMIKENYGFSFAQIGLITFFFQMASSVVQPLVGIYADRRPRPYALTAGMCFTLTGLLLVAFAQSFYGIMLAVTILGFGSSIFHPEASRVAQMASGGRKSLAQSIFQVGGNAGTALGPILAALLIIPFGQSAVAWVGIVAVLAAILLSWIGRWYKTELVFVANRPSLTLKKEKIYSRKTIHWAMTILVVLMFSKYIYISCMTNYFTFFLMDKFSVSVEVAQYCLFGFLAASAVGTLVGGLFGDRYGRKYVILGSIFGAAPFTLLLPYASFGWTMVLAVLVGLIISSAFSSIVVYATDLYPTKVGMVSGLFFGLMFGLGGIGSAFFGWLADQTSVEYIFRISTLLPLFGAIAAFLPNPQKR